MLTYLSPGLRFFHEGQFEGRQTRISPHLSRRPDEPADGQLAQLYARLLAILRQPTVREGRWSLLQCIPAWPENATSINFIAFVWVRSPQQWLSVVVNYSPQRSQCFVRMSFSDLSGRNIRFQDLLSSASYDRPGDDLLSRGLFVDIPAWGCHVFDVVCQEQNIVPFVCNRSAEYR